MKLEQSFLGKMINCVSCLIYMALINMGVYIVIVAIVRYLEYSKLKTDVYFELKSFELWPFIFSFAISVMIMILIIEIHLRVNPVFIQVVEDKIIIKTLFKTMVYEISICRFIKTTSFLKIYNYSFEVMDHHKRKIYYLNPYVFKDFEVFFDSLIQIKSYTTKNQLT